ncbi:MAG: hypothetical protein KGJ65_10115 [Betaproteobacteria bacterium]|nr:hypothetical protein [Betaproteobacteria bacterium]MDE2185312.1 hypothetical protein [Betaproteobacteria bacterium]
MPWLLAVRKKKLHLLLPHLLRLLHPLPLRHLLLPHLLRPPHLLLPRHLLLLRLPALPASKHLGAILSHRTKASASWLFYWAASALEAVGILMFAAG